MNAPSLELIGLRREGDLATVTLALGNSHFEDCYIWREDRVVLSPRSPMNFTREEFALHRIVERIRAGERVSLPVPIIVPDDLPQKALRRWSFFDTETGKALLARSAA